MICAQSRRVAITGIGLVTPLGATTAQTWQAICEGRSGITSLPPDRYRDYPVTIGGLVRGEQEALDALLSPKDQNKTDRFTHLAELAAQQAVTDANLTLNEHEKTHAGVYIGVGLSGLPAIANGVRDLDARGARRVSPYLIPKVIANAAASAVSIRHNFRGAAMSISTACSSGADALGHAWRTIMSGSADIMLAGGAESLVIPITIGGFGNMRALAHWREDPTTASRPFDKNRCGFVLAEGAGMLVLEEYERAVTRGATIYAQLVGYGQSSDAFHAAAIHPNGRGAQAAITQALQTAGCQARDIGYINAHGTSTVMNDAIEAQTINSIFAHRPLVSSTKSMTGHMLGAAGGVEVGLTALALHNNCAPPTINLDTPDLACDLNHVRVVTGGIGQYAISNSFGFGGANAALVLKKDDER